MNKIIVGKSAFCKLLVIGFLAFLFTALTLFGAKQRALASAFGPSPVHTNAPGEGNCTECHSDFGLNSGEGGVTISGVPETYSPGQQLTITVTSTQADAVVYGFQLTAIDAGGLRVGRFDIPAQSEGRIQILQGVVGDSNVREYVEHTSGGLSNGQFGFNSWVFTWTAPAEPAGRVDFYVASNSANSDGRTGGDYIYTTSRSTTSSAAGPVSITGRVTTPSGLALANARVILTNSAGVQSVVTTSSFGIYNFSNVPSGPSYTLTIQSKRYRFAPQLLTPTGNLANIDFVGLE